MNGELGSVLNENTDIVDPELSTSFVVVWKLFGLVFWILELAGTSVLGDGVKIVVRLAFPGEAKFEETSC